MEFVPKPIADVAKKLFKKAKEYNRPPKVIKLDENRLERENDYRKRVNMVNPRIQSLNERRIRNSKRRSL